MSNQRDAGSFRDPSGHVYRDSEGTLYRQINRRFLPEYERFVDSGCCDALIDQDLLVSHDPADVGRADDTALAGAVIRPRELPFISYPYEWCFEQLRDAALATLRAQTIALDHGHCLRDASAFNVQFDQGRPILIDTLSFGPYETGKPWVAYRQFCMHFLAPLAAIAYGLPDAATWMRTHIDGLPLPEVARMLPMRARLNGGLLIHLIFHARAELAHLGDEKPAASGIARVSEAALRGTLMSLQRTIESLRPPRAQSHWRSYYDDNSYNKDAESTKERFVDSVLGEIKPASVWDLGTNTGRFARIAARHGANVVAMDSDRDCVSALHEKLQGNRAPVLPLVMDLANPSPALGWAHGERRSLLDRGPADCALALALVHHLAISNNVPLPMVADFLARCGEHVVVEWVPKDDPMVQRLLASREDIFEDYEQSAFERSLEYRFDIVTREPLPGSGRVLYHAKAHG